METISNSARNTARLDNERGIVLKTAMAVLEAAHHGQPVEHRYLCLGMYRVELFFFSQPFPLRYFFYELSVA
jgi:hypothetical protein